MVTRSQDGTRRQKIYKDYQMNYSTKHLLTAFSATAIQVEPTCFSQANKSPEWRRAMGEEFDALQYNATWTLTPRPAHKNVVRNKGCIR